MAVVWVNEWIVPSRASESQTWSWTLLRCWNSLLEQLNGMFSNLLGDRDGNNCSCIRSITHVRNRQNIIQIADTDIVSFLLLVWGAQPSSHHGRRETKKISVHEVLIFLQLQAFINKPRQWCAWENEELWLQQLWIFCFAEGFCDKTREKSSWKKKRVYLQQMLFQGL